MEQMTVTAKIQICVSDRDRQLLSDTTSVYRAACNYVSAYIFRTHDMVYASVDRALYHEIRERFGLKSQMAQSAIKTVIAKYSTILENQKKWIRPDFRKPQYDLVWNRDYSLTRDCFSVNTLEGRVHLPYFTEGMEKYFDHDTYRFGTAKLVFRHGKYYLHIPVTYEVEESQLSDICNVVGIDRGINFIIATYDSNQKSGFVSGREVKQKRAHYSALRKELQMRQTPSARQRLKAIGQRENRWMQDVNHCVSKALVENNPEHTLFVLEDLTGIRSVTERVRRKDRYVFVSWSYYDLEQKIIYKAKQHKSSVVLVDPRYTSQTCPVCGHTEKYNRNKKLHRFCCKNCGYRSNDDRVAAMNLHRMGILYLEESIVPDAVG
jgi:IS605 OrfB family transposase